jgi:hypothetical protein
MNGAGRELCSNFLATAMTGNQQRRSSRHR